jgi:hypothetical protein
MKGQSIEKEATIISDATNKSKIPVCIKRDAKKR